ncbi:MAG: ComEA family DNA-binding protein [Bacteroidia bacterium]
MGGVDFDRYRLYRTPSWAGLGVWVGIVVGLGAWEILSRQHAPLEVRFPTVSLQEQDSLRWLSLPVVRPYQVGKILYFQRVLGPFWSPEELELLLDSVTFDAIYPYIQGHSTWTDTLRLNLNAVDSVTLTKYRILRPEAARRFIRYRYKVSFFESWAQIESLRIWQLEKNRLRKVGYLGKADREKFSFREKAFRLELNVATAEELEKLPMIGPKLAGRIVRFREKLGFFHDVMQLREVYGLSEMAYQKIRDKVYITKETVEQGRRLCIHTAPVELLAAHPYLSWKDARKIDKLRRYEQITVEDIARVVSDSTYRKILPYLQGC